MRTTLLLWVVLLYGAQALSDADPFEAYAPDQRVCIQANNLDVHVIDQEFGWTRVVREGNEEVNKFLECSWKSSEIMDKDGHISFEKLLPGIRQVLYAKFPGRTPAEIITFLDKVTKGCSHLKGTTHGDTAVKIHNCVNEYLKEGK